ncbi:flagellar filament capping protein FliD [Aneurinibacillus sp. REN35]|uniref:flagellar filament capping protein FliD n=1 Tax=Aneurinibacillus sp. REN35 TaxID=3237286 RepID=UPI0035298424
MPVNRLSGLMSGMDTESLVKQLMQAERMPVNKMKQQRQSLTWQSEMYRQWNTDIFTFRKTLLDMKLSKTYGTFNAVSSDANKVNVTSTAESLEGNHKMQVLQLAELAKLEGKPSLSTPSGAATLTININGKSKDIEIAAEDTMKDIVTKINTATVEGKSLGVSAAYDETLNQFVINSKETGTKSTFTLSGAEALQKLGIKQYEKELAAGATIDFANIAEFGALGRDITLKVGDIEKSIKVTSADNVDTILARMKKAFSSEGEVFSKNGTKIEITHPAGKVVKISSSNEDTLSKLGVSGASFDANIPVKALGKDAQFRYNDGEIIETPANNTTVFGLNYNFKQIGEVTTTVSRDIETEIKNIKEFINKYNEILDKLNKVIDEPVYRSFKPLTDEEREALSEKQIEQWEQKAKSGLLRRDGTLSALASNIRLQMGGTVDNGSKYNSLASIGIKSNTYKDQGKLQVDEEKLRKVLQEDPEAVKNLFIQSASDEKSGKTGLIHRVTANFEESSKLLIEKAGASGSAITDSSLFGKRILDLNKRIDDTEDRLIRKENNYYAKFTAMEKAMSKYNSQSGWLAQQFAAK